MKYGKNPIKFKIFEINKCCLILRLFPAPVVFLLRQLLSIAMKATTHNI